MRTQTLISNLKSSKKILTQFNKDLPNEDPYVMVYCIVSDLIKEITSTLKEVKPALKEARKLSKDRKKKNGRVSST